MTKFLLPLLAASALALAACGSDSSSTDPGTGASDSSNDSPGLDGHDFLSTEVEGQTLVDGTEIRLEFADGSIRANVGCNSMGGDYVLEGQTLMVGPFVSTEMGCDQALMDQDIWLANFLASSPTVSLDDDLLTLKGDGTTIKMLDLESADPDRPIEGTLWIVDGIVADETVSSIPGDATASITIVAGEATIETGCNNAGGSVEVTGTTLTFGPMPMTLMACPPAETELESAVLAVFDGEVDYEIEADRLSLRRDTPNGVVGLNLTADK